MRRGMGFGVLWNGCCSSFGAATCTKTNCAKGWTRQRHGGGVAKDGAREVVQAVHRGARVSTLVVTPVRWTTPDHRRPDGERRRRGVPVGQRQFTTCFKRPGRTDGDHQVFQARAVESGENTLRKKMRTFECKTNHPTNRPAHEEEKHKHVEKFSVRNPGQLDLRVQASSSG